MSPQTCTMVKCDIQRDCRGVIPGGAGGGGCGPPTFGQQHFFSGFSHTTDRKVPSEVVLMGSFMSVIYGNVR